MRNDAWQNSHNHDIVLDHHSKHRFGDAANGGEALKETGNKIGWNNQGCSNFTDTRPTTNTTANQPRPQSRHSAQRWKLTYSVVKHSLRESYCSTAYFEHVLSRKRTDPALPCVAYWVLTCANQAQRTFLSLHQYHTLLNNEISISKHAQYLAALVIHFVASLSVILTWYLIQSLEWIHRLTFRQTTLDTFSHGVERNYLWFHFPINLFISPLIPLLATPWHIRTEDMPSRWADAHWNRYSLSTRLLISSGGNPMLATCYLCKN